MIEIDKLLQPISPESPAGANLRLASGDLTFSKLAELRRETDAELDAGGEARAADWKGVVRESSVALAERSKDLELAATLTQGLVGTDGFPGLVVGLRLVRQLIERYWDRLHPGYEDGEIVLPIRARPLAWLGSSREFLTTVKRVPIAGGAGAPARTWLDYEQSRRVDGAQTRSDQQAYRELVDSGFIGGEQWAAALAASPPGQLQLEAAALREALGELEALRKICDEKFGDEAPAMIELRNLLGDCADQIDRALGGAGVAAGAGAAAGTAAAAVGPAIGMVLPASAIGGVLGGAAGALGAGAGLGGGGPRGPIASREQAYRILREVADYLRRAEPHSPVAPLLDRVVKWEKLSFPALFEDVVKNSDARAQLLELLGLNKPDQS